MARTILAVIAGFIAWSILWVGSDQVIANVSPDWWGAHQLAMERAITNQTEFTADSTILILNIVRSAIISLLSGFLAAMVAGENRRSALWLGILLLLVGIFVQTMMWNYIPIVYHLVFLALLVPMTILGGKLKSSA